jgi:hypothetical protein
MLKTNVPGPEKTAVKRDTVPGAKQKEKGDSKRPKVNPAEVVPLKLVLKAEPPIIGVFYSLKSDPKKKHIYNILLTNLLQTGDSAEITEVIYTEHHRVLDPEKIPPEQVQTMVERLLDYYMRGEDDEEEYEMYGEGEGDEEIDEEQYRKMMAAAQNREIFMTNMEEFEESGGLENIDEMSQEQLNQLYKQKVSAKITAPSANTKPQGKQQAGANKPATGGGGRKKDDLNSSF